MRREFAPQAKGGKGIYFLLFFFCAVAFIIIEYWIPDGLYTAPLVFVVFAAAAAVMYRFLSVFYSRMEFILSETEFFVITAIGHKERILLSLPVENVRQLFSQKDCSSLPDLRTDTFGPEGEGYSAVLYYDEALKCDRIAKFSVSEAFFQEFSEKALDIREKM